MSVTVRDISVNLGGKHPLHVLDHVGFQARDGEFLSLLGSSGAGKTTLLKVIAGILVQDAGSVALGGEEVDGLAPHKRQIGFVFQDTRLFPHMSVEENVAFPCKMAHMPKGERLEQARSMLALVHLEGFGGRDPASLSGGQQQRVALARALAAKPQVLLLDEPFSGLDESLRDDMRSLVLKLHRAFGITTILVTHDAVEALEMSDTIVYISKGRTVQQGTPEELFATPASAETAACFGECCELEGAVAGGKFTCAGLTLPAPLCPDGAACAVVRFAGVSAEEDAAATLRVRCSVYRGGSRLLRVDVDGQTLTVPSERKLPDGTPVRVRVRPESLFVFPLDEGR
ncbi:MAG: ABC transporter ATP-binding protein [Eggerthellaceae bacterium]|nr:ABC transporter ATP-binding protein [Eggerthellaceae bacterium]